MLTKTWGVNMEIIPQQIIERKIYLSRGHKVMLDKDLAELYGVKPIRLREQVKRNIRRFPDDFMFHLNEQEIEIMVSQNAIPSRKYLGGHLPYVFTEHGVLMLSNVIKSERAIKMSIRIIEIFIKLREMLLTHKDILLKLQKMEKTIIEHDEKIQLIFDYLKKLLTQPEKPIKKIGYKIKGYK